MESPESVDQGTLEEGADGLDTDVGSLSDAELQEFLNTSPEGEEQSEPRPDAESDSSDEKLEAAEQQEEQPEEVEAKQEEKPAEQPSAEEQVEQLRRQLAAKEDYIKRRSSEIGELRKRNRDLVTALEARAETAQEEGDTRLVARIENRLAEVKKEEAGLSEEEDRTALAEESINLVKTYVRPEEFDIDAITQELKEEGYHPALIEQVRRDPFSTMRGETLIHLAKSSYKSKVIKHVNDKILPYVKHLESKVAELEKAKLTTGHKVLDKVKKAAQGAQPLQAKASASTNPKRQPEIPFERMSDAELEAYLAQNRE
jgi:hypothetical protein